MQNKLWGSLYKQQFKNFKQINKLFIFYKYICGRLKNYPFIVTDPTKKFFYYKLYIFYKYICGRLKTILS